jgi:putative ABC transport system substrate-binding protein
VISKGNTPSVKFLLLIVGGLGLLAGLVADTVPVAWPMRLLFLGYQGEAADAYFGRFKTTLAARHPTLFEHMRFDYVQGAEDDETVLPARLKQALGGALPAHIVLAPTHRTALIAKSLVSPVPLVFASHPDPVTAGLIEVAMPRRQAITGVSQADQLSGKRIELLHDAYPALHKLAVLADRYWLDTELADGKIAAVAARHGMSLSAVAAETEADVRRVMGAAGAADFDAWYIPASYVAYVAEAAIIERLRALKVPAIHATTGEVKLGALMAYAQDTSFVTDALADLVARVLAGEDARTIPIERPRRYVLAVRADAEALALGMSPAMLRQADQVYADAVSPAK